MESKQAGEFANQKASPVAIVAMYAYADVEAVGSNTIAVVTINSSLSAVFQVYSWRQVKSPLIESHPVPAGGIKIVRLTSLVS
jgi:hypothetical protein